MRKILFAAYLSLCCITVGKAQEDSYKIEGRLGQPLNTRVILMAETEKGIIELSDATITNGNFEFTGRMPETTVAYLMSAKKDMVLATLFLENAPYTITAGPTALMVEGGGEAQKIWKEFEVLKNAMEQIRQKAQAQAAKATSSTQVEGLSRELQKVTEAVLAKENELIAKHRGSMVSTYVVASQMQGMAYEQLAERYELLDKSALANFYGKQLTTVVNTLKQVAMGATAPDFSAPLADGGVLALYETKGKVKVVNFWASWHNPSRQENVNMLQIYKRFRPKGVEIIGVALDDNKQAWLKAIGEDGSDWKNVSDLKGQASEIAAAYCVTNLPCNFVLDEENRIVAKNLYGRELEQKITEMLKKKK